MAIPRLFVKGKHARRYSQGHPWIFSNELQEVPRNIASGSLVELVDHRQQTIGLGLYNPHSLISVRLLGPGSEMLAPDTPAVWLQFFEKRLKNALALRQRLFPGENSYRLVFGESDFLPGLVIDRYEDAFSLQTLSAGMDQRKDLIARALLLVFPQTRLIAERNTSALRRAEGLPEARGMLWPPEQPEAEAEIGISESGFRYSISLLEGQKTGFFFDQRQNRLALHNYARGLKVMDCFSNQGGFALHCARAGAREVTAVDSSAQAIASARSNAALNGLANISFAEEEVVPFLKRQKASDNWEMIILDPPSFTKSKSNVGAARRGYAEINRLALELLPPGGFLVTASCSHHVFEDVFLEIVQQQSIIAGKPLRLLFRGMQSPDHPVLAGMPETRYLKFFVFQVCPQ